MYQKDHDYLICLNNHCKRLDLSGAGIEKQEMRFLYNIPSGRVSELRLWMGNKVRIMKHLFGKLGPYPAKAAQGMVYYFKMSGGTRDTIYYDY